MKLNQIILFFALVLPASIVMRLYQLLFTVDSTTGFYTIESGNNGVILLIFIFLFCFATYIFATFAHSKPEQPPSKNVFLSISAVLLSFAIFYDIKSISLTANLLPWQSTLLKIAGSITAIYLITYAVLPYTNTKTPPILNTLPTIYIIIKIICDFTSISKLALISDNILLITTYCVLLLFVLNFAKLYNGIDNEYNFKKLLSFGLVSIILCFTNSIPYFIMNIITNNQYTHITLSTNIVILFFGIFISVFLLSHFSKNNLSK